MKEGKLIILSEHRKPLIPHLQPRPTEWGTSIPEIYKDFQDQLNKLTGMPLCQR